MPILGLKPTPAGRMLRTARYKYCVYDQGEHRESLVDLEADPGAMNNLARESPFAAPLSNLDAKMRVSTRTEISKLHSRLGATMIYVTHDQGDRTHGRGIVPLPHDRRHCLHRPAPPSA